MKSILYKLTSDSNGVKVSRLTPGNPVGGLETLAGPFGNSLPPIPGEEVFALELWAEDEEDNDELKRLGEVHPPYISHEHSGFFYNMTVLLPRTA